MASDERRHSAPGSRAVANPVYAGVFPWWLLRGLVAILLIGGIVFPLVGASLLIMLALDWLVCRSPKLRVI